MVPQTVRSAVRRALPPRVVNLYRMLRDVRGLAALAGFLFWQNDKLSFAQRLHVVRRILVASTAMYCPHTNEQIIDVIKGIISLPRDLEGCIVESGSCKGGSATKFSVVAKLLNRRLVLFDSFEGIPDNTEPHQQTIFGDDIVGHFKGGAFRGTLDEVKRNIAACGEIDVCEFVQGWFNETMPHFSKPVAAAFLDVDLADSTRTCVKYLYPLMPPGGLLYSQDGQIPLVVQAFDDDEFWQREVGCPKPTIEGLGTQQLLKITKP